MPRGVHALLGRLRGRWQRPADDEPCRCGHAFAVHQHLRAGTDCALCPQLACRSFRRR